MAAKGKTRWKATELAQKIDGYFASLEADPAKRGGPSDLLACIGMDMETATTLAGETGGCGPVLRQAATRLRAHLETSPDQRFQVRFPHQTTALGRPILHRQAGNRCHRAGGAGGVRPHARRG